MTETLTSHLLVDQLVAEGFRHIFASSGCNVSPIIAAADGKMQHTMALHTGIAGSMALGYAQAMMRPAVMMVPAGYGVAECLPTLLNAKQSRLPIIVLADQQDSQVFNDDPPLASNDLALGAPLCKWTCEVKTANEVPRIIRRALHETMCPPKGPVLISLPINILGRPALGKAIPSIQSSPIGPADPSFLTRAAKLITQATRPVIICGNEVSQYRARQESVVLAEVLGCPVFSEPVPTGVNFPNRHPLYAGVLPLDLFKAHKAVEDCDLAIVLGMQLRLPPRSDEPALFGRTTQVIQINVEPQLAGRTLPCNLAANADIAETLSRLRAEIQLIVDSQWVQVARTRAQNNIGKIAKVKQQFEEALNYPDASTPVPLFWLYRVLDSVRPQKSTVVTDLVSGLTTPMDVMSLETSSSYYSINSGVEGYALPAAMGVQVASPESTVLCLTSDHSLLQYPQALWTAAHYRLNVKLVLVNSLGTSNYNLQLPGFPRINSTLDNPQVFFPDLSASMTIKSQRVLTMAQLEPALTKMFESNSPFIVDVRIQDQARQ